MKRKHNGLLIISLITALMVCSSAIVFAAKPENKMSRYNVIWNTPSKDASGVMPVGNGDIAAGVYAIENGDLYLLLAKNDAYTYMGDIFKTGRVKISLNPNPFMTGKSFSQTLDLVTGSILIEADGTTLRIWADANRPVFHVEIFSPVEVAATVTPDLWKRIDNTASNLTEFKGAKFYNTARDKPTQDVQVDRNGKILWYFPVGDRSIYPDDLKYYGVEHMSSKFPDPFRFNTFGNLLESPHLFLTSGKLTGKGKTFDIRIHALTLQTPDPVKWIETIEQQATRQIDVKKDWENHKLWWSDFWNRSWIIANDNTLPEQRLKKLNGEASALGTRMEEDGAALTAQSYNVFRFLMACQSRGKVQTKFNGGLFTQQLRHEEKGKPNRAEMLQQADGSWLTNEDDRPWGRRFTYQNQRLLYWPLLASGDFDMMKPFFDYYSNLLPVRKAITKSWFGHEGAYYRENIEPTGAERDCGLDGLPPRKGQGEPATYYHDYYFTSGLETVTMMTDYVNFSGDLKFRDNTLVPFAREVLLFFDRHYSRETDGKLRIDPAQVVETWWSAVNPSPDVAGLRFCMDELLAMKAGTREDQANWKKFLAEIPEVPLQTIEGSKVIAPAEKWDIKRNAENGELYPVFPFRCFGLSLGSEDIVSGTMKNRTHKDAFNYACWTQDQIHWAYAGNATECAKGLVERFRNASTMCRFPLYGKEGPDSCPDFDHFGAGSTALQRMLVQEAKGKILLFPAWPKVWDVDFKQFVSGGAVISGTVKDGKIVKWNIEPASRRSEVKVCLLQ